MDNILVTGGAGYIGSHVCLKLKEMGYNPITFDNLVTGWRDAVQFGPFVKGDLLDPSDLDLVFSTWCPKAVMHFAALSEVGASIRFPGQYWRNNVLGSLNLLESMAQAECKKLVFSSTCSIYGESDKDLVLEDTPTNPLNPYSASKKAVEDMISGFVEAMGMNVVRFRYFNVSGADPKGRIGEFHKPETHLIPLLLENICTKNGRIEIFGNDYPTPDGTCIRDFIHVEDIANAHLLGLEKLLADNAKDEVYNLGNGIGYSVREIIDSCLKVTNGDIPIVIKGRRQGDSSSIVSGSKKANLELGWNCQYQEIEKIISDSWNWVINGDFNR